MCVTRVFGSARFWPVLSFMDAGARGRSGESRREPESEAPWKRREHGSRWKPNPGPHRLPHSLGNLADNARFPLFHRADGSCSLIQTQTIGSSVKPDNSRVNKTEQ